MLNFVYTARRYASAVYAVACLSVRYMPVPERLNVGSRKQRNMITQGF